ncbi:ketohydroxyglutarate aldolase [Allosaccharopolyspora coralli]|uniref:Ketohydroxyglutarate aldolase n=1 Tax=Allosaccharopolyspora coralli TaxID=2665642 RepID=A0A5Q3Q6X7_9PSEU|nr:ketohydroxyglutarate aldolase [Allosaccharopolyspora coralli]QGK70083.1 ketohydroxyglutarate aldolase [Allosaccharopolyspora coralli]
MTDDVAVVVVLDDDHLGAETDVVEQLASAGFVTERVQHDLGTVTGTVARASVRSLESIPGVAAVEQQRTPGVPPPDADVQ